MTTRLSAAEFFAAKLAYETDPADLAAARAAGEAARRRRTKRGRL